MDIKTVVTILLVCLGVLVFLAWFFSHKAKHLERLRLIEKGIYSDSLKNNDNRFLWKRIGAILLGLGAGLLIISILIFINPKLVNINSMPLAILIICCGIAIVFSNKDKRSKGER